MLRKQSDEKQNCPGIAGSDALARPTSMNEIRSTDVEKWANYWASAKVDAVALSVSGPVAFYPTEVPFFHRSSYLKDRDLFGECVKAAKERGIRVYTRMSLDMMA